MRTIIAGSRGVNQAALMASRLDRPTLLATLSQEQASKTLHEAWWGGKHAAEPRQAWPTAGRAEPYAHVLLPLSLLAPNADGMLFDGTVNADRCVSYADRRIDTPISVSFSDRRARKALGVAPEVSLLDGGHRVSAARLRGEAVIPALIPVSHLASLEAAITRHANFSRWFGRSQVVSVAGVPAVVYHGTYVQRRDGVDVLGNIEAFDRLMSVKVARRAPSLDTVGSWFSSSAGESGAGLYGDTLYPVYLAIQNPFITTFEGFKQAAQSVSAESAVIPDIDALRGWLKAAGYDGIRVVHDARASNGSTEFEQQTAWIALEPDQIKSVFNSGAFDPYSPSLTDAEPTPRCEAEAFVRTLHGQRPHVVLELEELASQDYSPTHEVWAEFLAEHRELGPVLEMIDELDLV